MSLSLIEANKRIKKRFLEMYFKAKAGHVGCSLSCTEILTFARFVWMKDEDFIILSKGHAAAVLYSVLAEYGSISEAEIGTFYQNGTLLSAHPPVNKLPHIPFATGSLGHGLSLATGLALAQRLKKSSKKVFCVTSDGEINEGSTWEAALFASHHKLSNMIWLIDRNRLQGFGHTEDIMALDPLDKKLEAFGFNVLEIDGHDFASFERAKEWAEAQDSKNPCAIICNTKKGHQWEAYEGKLDCHYLPMNQEDFDQLMLSIG